MAYKKWVKRFFTLVLSVILLFGLFNYSIDPLWTFCHSNRYNNAQPGFDERQLKTNRAYFCGLEQYDSLMLGSSRVTYINQHDFKSMNVFNYAAVSMYPKEYSAWIETAKSIKGKAFKTIIIGTDFATSNNGHFGQSQINATPKASYYFDITRSFMYRYKMLFNMDTLDKSLESIEHSKKLGTVDYTRENVKQTIRISKERRAQALNHQIPLYSYWVYGEKYHFNTKLKKYFLEIKKQNPHSDFIIFTTPIHVDLFKLLVQSGRLDDYKRWMRLMVDVFGEVYDFMGINSITKNQENYADLHHFYPEFGELIADRVTGVKNDKLPDDFGVLVTKENIEKHLKQIEQQAKSLIE